MRQPPDVTVKTRIQHAVGRVSALLLVGAGIFQEVSE
jgi:hypothetical protein